MPVSVPRPHRLDCPFNGYWVSRGVYLSLMAGYFLDVLVSPYEKKKPKKAQKKSIFFPFVFQEKSGYFNDFAHFFGFCWTRKISPPPSGSRLSEGSSPLDGFLLGVHPSGMRPPSAGTTRWRRWRWPARRTC